MAKNGQKKHVTRLALYPDYLKPISRSEALSHPKNVHFCPFFWPFFWPFLGDFQDPFPDYSPFFDTQIAILISFSGSHLWMDFWANFGPFSDAKSPLKTGFYGYRKWAPKNGWNWTEKTTQNASKISPQTFTRSQYGVYLSRSFDFWSFPDIPRPAILHKQPYPRSQNAGHVFLLIFLQARF